MLLVPDTADYSRLAAAHTQETSIYTWKKNTSSVMRTKICLREHNLCRNPSVICRENLQTALFIGSEILFQKPVTGKQYQMLTKNSYMWMSNAAGANNTGLLKEVGVGLEAGKLHSS